MLAAAWVAHRTRHHALVDMDDEPLLVASSWSKTKGKVRLKALPALSLKPILAHHLKKYNQKTDVMYAGQPLSEADLAWSPTEAMSSTFDITETTTTTTTTDATLNLRGEDKSQHDYPHFAEFDFNEPVIHKKIQHALASKKDAATKKAKPNLSTLNDSKFPTPKQPHRLLRCRKDVVSNEATKTFKENVRNGVDPKSKTVLWAPMMTPSFPPPALAPPSDEEEDGEETSEESLIYETRVTITTRSGTEPCCNAQYYQDSKVDVQHCASNVCPTCRPVHSQPTTTFVPVDGKHVTSMPRPLAGSRWWSSHGSKSFLSSPTSSPSSSFNSGTIDECGSWTHQMVVTPLVYYYSLFKPWCSEFLQCSFLDNPLSKRASTTGEQLSPQRPSRRVKAAPRQRRASTGTVANDEVTGGCYFHPEPSSFRAAVADTTVYQDRPEPTGKKLASLSLSPPNSPLSQQPRSTTRRWSSDPDRSLFSDDFDFSDLDHSLMYSVTTIRSLSLNEEEEEDEPGQISSNALNNTLNTSSATVHSTSTTSSATEGSRESQAPVNSSERATRGSISSRSWNEYLSSTVFSVATEEEENDVDAENDDEENDDDGSSSTSSSSASTTNSAPFDGLTDDDEDELEEVEI
ncbi:hypothetical protein ACA910_016477 [Epithemia clementina (nom. ined.)]